METSVKIQDKVQDKIAAWWEKVIAKMEQYYPLKANRVEQDFQYAPHPTLKQIVWWSCIVNDKKEWFFEMCRSLLCNFQYGDPVNIFHANIVAGRTSKEADVNEYRKGDSAYTITAKRYLNGNTLVKIEKRVYKDIIW